MDVTSRERWTTRRASTGSRGTASAPWSPSKCSSAPRVSWSWRICLGRGDRQDNRKLFDECSSSKLSNLCEHKSHFDADPINLRLPLWTPLRQLIRFRFVCGPRLWVITTLQLTAYRPRLFVCFAHKSLGAINFHFHFHFHFPPLS